MERRLDLLYYAWKVRLGGHIGVPSLNRVSFFLSCVMVLEIHLELLFHVACRLNDYFMLHAV